MIQQFAVYIDLIPRRDISHYGYNLGSERKAAKENGDWIYRPGSSLQPIDK